MFSTLEDLLARVVSLDERKLDLIADTRVMSLDEDNPEHLLVDLDSGVVDARLSDHALGQMATDLAIPKKYFDRMREDAPDLFRTNVHHWLTAEPKRRLLRAYRDVNGGDGLNGGDDLLGRAWLSDRYRRIDHIEIARTLLPEFEKLGTEVKFHNAAVTEERFYLRATFPAMETEIKIGSPVHWGVEIRNSEIGSGTFSISGFVLTLSCLNGMTVSKELNARHVGRRLDDDGIFTDETLKADDTAFWLAARDTLRAAISETRFEEVVSQLRETTTTEPIIQPLAATEVLQRQYALSDEERNSVLNALYIVGDMSQWGLLSAVTNAAQSRDSFDRQAEMEEMGWELAQLPEREWATLARAV